MIPGFNKNTINSQAITQLCQQLLNLLNAKIALAQALTIMQTMHTKQALQQLLQTLHASIISGTELATALSQHPQYFDRLFIHLIKAGEATGTLPIMLKHIITYRQQRQMLLKRLTRASLYPLITLSVALLITMSLVTIVIPQFQQLFADFNHTLPTLTLSIINAATITKTYGWLMIIIVLLTITSLVLARRTMPILEYYIDRFMLHLPVCYSWVTQFHTARICRCLATLLAVNIPLTSAITMLYDITTHSIYRQALLDIERSLSQGYSLSQAIQATSCFPSYAWLMTNIGEETATLAQSIDHIAAYYEQALHQRLEQLNQWLEPLIIIIVGIVVGLIVFGLYLPIFQLGTTL